MARRAPMADNKAFIYAYGWNSFYEVLLGLWSRKSEGFVTRRRAWAWAFVMLFCIWAPQTASFTIIYDDLNTIFECLPLNMSFAIAIIKLVVMQCQRDVICSVLDQIAKDWERVEAEEEIRAMLRPAKIGRFISIISVSLTNFGSFCYVLSQSWMAGHSVKYSNMDPRLAHGFIYITYFPFDTTSIFVFVSIWVGQFIGSMVGAAFYSGPDCFLSMAVLHLCGQLNVLCVNLRNLVDNKIPLEPEIYWKRLSAIVKRHEELNQMGLVLKEAFSSILLLQMFVCSLSFCFQGYALFITLMDETENELPVLQLIVAIAFGFDTVMHLFIYCYVGDSLLVQSAKIADDFYLTAWYDLAPREARAFLFVCQRSRIPLELKAGKFCTFNLELFTSILKSSMGYLSMLMAMKERLIN